MPTAVIILAAGQGTRMKSVRPKVLHTLAGVPLLAHAMRTAQSIDTDRIIVVTGCHGEAVAAAARSFDDTVTITEQTEQLGTAHAVSAALVPLQEFSGNAIVIYGDTPLIRSETLQAMLEELDGGADVVALGFEAADPTGYGRLITEENGELTEIVEEKDADAAQRALRFCNSGVIAASRELLFELVSEVGNENAKGEYYLTDIVGLARARGLTARAIACPEQQTLGVNSRRDLAAAEASFQDLARSEAMENGVTLADPATVWFAFDTVIGRDTEIGQNVVFGPGVTIETGATIHPFCHLEGCHISRDASVGPFARLRPGAELAEGTRIGNFVEVKNATIDTGAKVNHLSYIGDAHLGAGSNIGAGTITCNYDGASKHRTEIGERVFVGSNTALVAPVSIGSDVLIGAGSVITDDAPDGALAVARAPQQTRPGLGKRLMAAIRSARTSSVKH